MLEACAGYRYVRNKCLVAFVELWMAPSPPEFNVELSWLTVSGFEVRKKRLVYVKAVVFSKQRLNIEIGDAGGSTTQV